MEPQIRYARTSDGVNIAYSVSGEGYPLVFVSHVLWSHIGQPHPVAASALGRSLKIIRFDARGSGLSDRQPLDFSLEARLTDLSAVIDALALDRFALFGAFYGAFAALPYAVQHSERVSHLILLNPAARGADVRNASSIRAIDSFRLQAKENWEAYRLATANTHLSFTDAARARQMAEQWGEAMTPEAVTAFWEAVPAYDITSLLPRVTMPTLVLFQQEVANDIAWAREVAAHIPNARLVVTRSGEYMTWTAEQTRAVEEFLGVEGRARGETPGGVAHASGTAVILFADIADSTALTERMGDAGFRAAARALDERLRAAIRDAGGTPVEGKVLGDGVMAVFTSAREAIDAALRCHTLSAESELRLHLGIHAGDVIREENNVYGGAVNVAARVCALSAPGEVLVSATVRDLARTSAGVTFEDRGEREMKGVGEPVRVYEVRWREEE